jgi:hypothetical protein
MVVASEHGAVVRLFVSHHCWCLRWSWSWSQSVLHDVTPAASWSRLYYRLPKPLVSCRNLASLSVALRCATRLISRDELSGSLAGQRRADLRTGMTSAQPAEARLESAGQGRPWRRRCCRAHGSSPPRHEERENGRQQQCRGVQPLKSQGPPASVGRRRGQTRSCGRGLRLKAEGPSPSASHPLLAPTAQRLQCNAMQCVQPGLTPADRRLPVTATEDRGQRTEPTDNVRRVPQPLPLLEQRRRVYEV